MIILEPLNIKINRPIKDIRVFDYNTGRILKYPNLIFLITWYYVIMVVE